MKKFMCFIRFFLFKETLGVGSPYIWVTWVCKKSGLKPNPECPEELKRFWYKRVPDKICEECGE